MVLSLWWKNGFDFISLNTPVANHRAPFDIPGGTIYKFDDFARDLKVHMGQSKGIRP